MEKPDEMIALYKARGVEAHRVDDNVRLWITRISYRNNPKTGVREKHVNLEEAWLSHWRPSTEPHREAHREIVAMVANWNYLAPEHLRA